MIPEKITHEHVVKAIEDIDSKKVIIPPNRESDNYDVEYNGKRYPPKFVISRANFYANGSEWPANAFNAIEAKNFLPTVGFVVKLKFDIKPGDVIANQQISTLFQCGTQGGMRRSTKTNTLVLISDQTKPFYKDEWEGNVFYYTGMGMTGDQSVDNAQNKTLAESQMNGIEVHLFEVFTPAKYTYQGIVELAGKPLERTQKDKDGNKRKVVVFPLKLLSGNVNIPSYWQIAPGPQASFWRLCVERGIIPIFFNDVLGKIPDDILKYSRDQLIDHCKKNSAQLSDGQISARVDTIWTFIHTIRLGDYVLANKGQSLAVGWGVVSSDAKICRDGSEISFYRKVNWKDPALNKALDPELGRHFFTTISPLKKEQFDSVVNNGNLAYWVIPPLSNDPDRMKVWKKWKEYGTVNIMWKNLAEKLGDKLLNFSSYDDYKEAYLKIYPDSQADMVWKFISEMKEGDKILVCIGHQTIIGQGIVKSLAKIYNNNSEVSSERHEFFKELPIHREVAWEEFNPAVSVPSAISRLCSRGVKRISKEIYDQIFSPEKIDNPLFIKIQNILDYKKQVILYGPPGTGKTWTVSNFVGGKKRFEPEVKSITTDKKFFWFSANPARWDPNNLWKDTEIELWYGSIRSAFNDIEEGDLVFVYVSKDHHRIFGIATCSKKEFDTNNNPKVFIKGLQAIDGPDWSQMKDDSVLSNAKPVRMGARGTLFPLDQYEGLRLLDMAQITPQSVGLSIDEQQEKIDNCTFVTFHPTYSYEEFIEGLRPEKDENGNIYYKVQEGIFKSACRRAFNALLREAEIEDQWEAETSIPHLTNDQIKNIKDIIDQVPVFFVIDEINRGDISRIFGELITLIEADKRLFMDTNIPCTLPYSKLEFGIPPNLYIIGTMNTADRSISLMDIALRRRFGFCELLPDYNALDILLLNDSDINDEVKQMRGLAINVLKSLNNRLVKNYDRDHQIGHSYFIKLAEQDTPDATKATLENIWRFEILPLLQEYFFDSPKKLCEVLNDRFFVKNENSFDEKFEENLITALQAVAQQKTEP